MQNIFSKIKNMHHLGAAASDAGFTLVELLVSLALFTIVVVAAVGSLYTINQASAKVGAMRTVLDNLNFATESMSRTIRTGSGIVCGGVSNTNGQTQPNCAFGNTNGPAQEISFTSTLAGDEGVLDYRRVVIPGSATNAHEIQKCQVQNNTPLNCVAVTSPNIDVTQLYFFVDGVGKGDGKQPSVTMIMQGVASAGTNNVAPFAIQTFISQRAAEQ
jgi:prepilin-type N-terminal cleavage/methylation domain-containing protein